MPRQDKLTACRNGLKSLIKKTSAKARKKICYLYVRTLVYNEIEAAHNKRFLTCDIVEYKAMHTGQRYSQRVKRCWWRELLAADM